MLRLKDIVSIFILAAIAVGTVAIIMDSGHQGPPPHLTSAPPVQKEHVHTEKLLQDDFKLVKGGEKVIGRPLENSFCCSSTGEVDESTGDLLHILNKITTRPFFRYYKVDIEKECPYWAVSLLCTDPESACTLCTCDASDVPAALRSPDDMSDVRIMASNVDQEIPTGVENVDNWGAWKKSGDEWDLFDKSSSSSLIYVDLLQNPESNTGYAGPLAARVWQAIYRENCIFLVDSEGNTVGDSAEGECNEMQIFKKLMSGMHMSISVHVASNFYRDTNGTSPQLKRGILNNPNISFFPNCDMYRNRIYPVPEFTDNLYVLHQFALRALTKARDVFLDDVHKYNSGDNGGATEEDTLLHAEIKELFEAKLLCSRTFDEARFLESSVAHAIVPQMKQMMVNVTTLMDCLTCEKCRLWGKLGMKGLLTAMKIILSPDVSSLTLGRSERVSLVNFARQTTAAVTELSYLREECILKPQQAAEESSSHKHAGDL